MSAINDILRYWETMGGPDRQASRYKSYLASERGRLMQGQVHELLTRHGCVNGVLEKDLTVLLCAALDGGGLPEEVSAPPEDGILAALRRAQQKLRAYVGVCKDDKELDTVLEMIEKVVPTTQGELARFNWRHQPSDKGAWVLHIEAALLLDREREERRQVQAALARSLKREQQLREKMVKAARDLRNAEFGEGLEANLPDIARDLEGYL